MGKPEVTNNITLKNIKRELGRLAKPYHQPIGGNKYNSFDHGRKDARAKSFKHAYNSKKNGRKC